MGLGACGRALIVLAIASSAAVRQPDFRLADWLDAIDTHQPGTVDRAVDLVAAAPAARLGELQDDLWRHLKALTDAERVRIVKRAAMLHFDVAATLHLRAGNEPEFPPPPIPRSPGQPLHTGGNILVNDGVVLGYERAGFHWRFGRALLGAMSPTPATDDFTRQWYRTAAAMMANLTMYSDLVTHLERAQALWPREAWVQMDRGALSECFGSPRLQVAARSGPLPSSMTIGIGSARTELENAERYFRAALALDPSFTAARLRLGRVLSLSGRHLEALAELARASGADQERATRYLAYLFSGRAYEALAALDEARKSYASAASLFPRAQAPVLSLSQLAARTASRVPASKALERILMVPDAGTEDDDPWWTYHRWHNDDLVRLVGALHAAVPPGGSQ